MLRTLYPMLVMIVLLIPISLGSSSTQDVDTDGYISHPPINIRTDDDFTAENGVVGGTGTPEDPYRISGWHIVPSRSPGTTNDRAIRIAWEVRDSYFLIEDNVIELQESGMKGVSVSSPVGGTIKNNIIISTDVQTFGVGLATGAGIENRQEPTQPLHVEGNTFVGQPDAGQIGVAIGGTAIEVLGNEFLDLDIAINIGASLTIGPMFIRINENDIRGAEWGAAAAIAHGNTLNVPVIIAQNNYWGHPEGPTPTVCSNTLGCPIFIGEEKGAYIAPNVLAYPYAEEPFYPD